MIKDYSLAVYDYQNNKMCDLSNYNISIKGDAYDITPHYETNGYKELNFKIPAKISDEDGNIIDNFRLEFIKNEYKVKLFFNDFEEEYIIKKVIKSRDDDGIMSSAYTLHLSD